MNAVIVALDFGTAADALAVVDRLGDAAPTYKVGLELLTAAGPAVVDTLVGKGRDVFLDLKLFEIPASVAGAVRAAGRLGVAMVTVHATGGPAILDAAVGAAADFPRLRVLALTVGAGASHVVIGRAIAKARDPLAALTAVTNGLAAR